MGKTHKNFLLFLVSIVTSCAVSYAAGHAEREERWRRRNNLDIYLVVAPAITDMGGSSGDGAGDACSSSSSSGAAAAAVVTAASALVVPGSDAPLGGGGGGGTFGRRGAIAGTVSSATSLTAHPSSPFPVSCVSRDPTYSTDARAGVGGVDASTTSDAAACASLLLIAVAQPLTAMGLCDGTNGESTSITAPSNDCAAGSGARDAGEGNSRITEDSAFPHSLMADGSHTTAGDGRNVAASSSAAPSSTAATATTSVGDASGGMSALTARDILPTTLPSLSPLTTHSPILTTGGCARTVAVSVDSSEAETISSESDAALGSRVAAAAGGGGGGVSGARRTTSSGGDVSEAESLSDNDDATVGGAETAAGGGGSCGGGGSRADIVPCILAQEIHAKMRHKEQKISKALPGDDHTTNIALAQITVVLENEGAFYKRTDWVKGPGRSAAQVASDRSTKRRRTQPRYFFPSDAAARFTNSLQAWGTPAEFPTNQQLYRHLNNLKLNMDWLDEAFCGITLPQQADATFSRDFQHSEQKLMRYLWDHDSIVALNNSSLLEQVHRILLDGKIRLEEGLSRIKVIGLHIHSHLDPCLRCRVFLSLFALRVNAALLTVIPGAKFLLTTSSRTRYRGDTHTKGNDGHIGERIYVNVQRSPASRIVLPTQRHVLVSILPIEQALRERWQQVLAHAPPTAVAQPPTPAFPLPQRTNVMAFFNFFEEGSCR